MGIEGGLQMSIGGWKNSKINKRGDVYLVLKSRLGIFLSRNCKIFTKWLSCRPLHNVRPLAILPHNTGILMPIHAYQG